MNQPVQNVIQTITANCQDCYRCVRACPVKAIKIADGQAHIEDELCIHCGTCVKNCPQQAKVTVSELDTVKRMLAEGGTVAASVAPSFAALFGGWHSSRLPAALRLLGFTHVAETAEGALQVSEKSLEKKHNTSICTACPAVVNLIEKYHPEYLDSLIPITSPMVLHGRMLKKRYGQNCKVVFIGPCAAKKQEAKREENRDAVDAVLTFGELLQWLEEEDINLANCSESGFESYGNLDSARLFPIQGGMLKTCGISSDNTQTDILHISGPEQVKEMLALPPEQWDYQIIEALFCTDGCINGPCYPSETGDSVLARKNRVIDYAKKAPVHPDPLDYEDLNSGGSFTTAEAVHLAPVDEDAINSVYEKTGKSNPTLRLNCGACGYESCRDNAIAVARGLAEPEMCMPYMRRLAQQRTDKVIETSPTAIVTLDAELNMISMNPAFKKMFMCNNEILGRKISYLIDAEGFEKLVAGTTDIYRSIKSKYGKRYHEVLYALPQEHQYVGLFTDISQVKFDSDQLDLIKRQTVEQAKELLAHQIKFSQEMAHYLGKSTAQNEEMVKQLIDFYESGK